MPANRTKTGQFAKGQSGNPSGRPKRSEVEVETIAAMSELAPRAVEVMREVLDDKDASPSIRLRCAESILERVCGRPMDAQQLWDYESGPKIDWNTSSFM